MLNWLFFVALGVLIYCIAFLFYKLSVKFGKGKIYVVFGLAMFVAGVALGVGIEYLFSDLLIPGTLRLPIALVSTWLLYRTFRSKWSVAGREAR